MSQTGQSCVIQVHLTKYGFAEVENMQKNVMRLTNQLWKLIPMKEHEEDWQKQLDTVILEITGLNEIFILNSVLTSLLSKLEGLRVIDISFNLYRKTVFESISLLQEFGRDFT